MNAFIDEKGVLVSFGYMESDNNNQLIEVSDDFSMAPGYARYTDEEWSEYAPPVDYNLKNQAIRDQLMSSAALTTQGMSDAFIAGLLSASEEATFKDWATYKLSLTKVNLSVESPEWPTIPGLD